MTSFVDGRAGNVMSAYASMMYYQQKYNLTCVLAQWQMDKITPIFKKESLEILSTEFVTPENLSINWQGVSSSNDSAGRGWGLLMPNPEFEQNIESYMYNKFLDIGLYPNFLWNFKHILSDLRKQFKFHDHLVKTVNDWKNSIQNETIQNVIFVGVHCRRTDFKDHLVAVSGSGMVDHVFYDKAFEIYRSRYNDDSHKIIFLAVSDDVEWIKEAMGKHDDVRFGFDFGSPRLNEPDLVGFDLCVLASCDHSIFAYGTFGLWGSLLAGGDVIVSKGLNNETYTEEDEIYSWASIPGWLYIDTKDRNDVQVLHLDENRQFVPIPDRN